MPNDLRSFHFETFKNGEVKWSYYQQRFEVELAIHGIDVAGEDARNLLLSKIGTDAFKILVDYFKPSNILTKSYNELKVVLNNYFGRKNYVLSERVVFAMRVRSENETVTQFVTSLRGLAGNCVFGAGLNKRLRDQLVIGIGNPDWQHALIKEHSDNTSTLAEVEATALKLEQASMHSEKLTLISRQQNGVTTCRIDNKRNKQKSDGNQSRTKRTNKQSCLFCGRSKHDSLEECPARGKTCYECGKINHFGKVCISKQRRQTRYVHQETSEGETSSSNTSSICHLRKVRRIYASSKDQWIIQRNVVRSWSSVHGYREKVLAGDWKSETEENW